MAYGSVPSTLVSGVETLNYKYSSWQTCSRPRVNFSLSISIYIEFSSSITTKAEPKRVESILYYLITPSSVPVSRLFNPRLRYSWMQFTLHQRHFV